MAKALLARGLGVMGKSMNTGSKRIIIVEALGSGFGLRLIRRACELGYDTVFLTMGRERYRHDVDKQILENVPANLQIVEGVDTRCADSIEEALRPLRTKETRVLAQVDRSMIATAEACQRLEIPHVSTETIQRCTNKADFREALRRNGVRSVKSVTVGSLPGIEGVVEEMDFPLVIKPAVGTASIGVSSVRSIAELTAETSELLKEGTQQVLIEEYLVGPLVSAECFVSSGKVHVFGLTDRTLSTPPSFGELAWSFPTHLDDDTEQQVKNLAQDVLDAVGLMSGPAHIEFVVTATGPVPVEINPRFAGRGLTAIVQEISDLDPYQLTLEAEFAPIELNGGNAPERFGAQHAIYGPPTSTVGAEVLETAKQIPGVGIIRFVPGADGFPVFTDNVDLGEVTAWAGTPVQAQMAARAAAQYVMGQITEPNRKAS
jgi:biotin carboxylase